MLWSMGRMFAEYSLNVGYTYRIEMVQVLLRHDGGVGGLRVIRVTHPGPHLRTFREESRNMQGAFRELSENIQGTFRKAGYIQGSFREHSRNIQGAFSEHSGNIQGTFKEAGYIQGTFRQSGNVQRTFREHSVRVERTPVSLHPNCKKHLKKVPRLTQNTTCKHEYLGRGLTRPNDVSQE
jgi:hypothetical protein